MKNIQIFGGLYFLSDIIEPWFYIYFLTSTLNSFILEYFAKILCSCTLAKTKCAQTVLALSDIDPLRSQAEDPKPSMHTLYWIPVVL